MLCADIQAVAKNTGVKGGVIFTANRQIAAGLCWQKAWLQRAFVRCGDVNKTGVEGGLH
jgi:hypothetical protein